MERATRSATCWPALPRIKRPSQCSRFVAGAKPLPAHIFCFRAQQNPDPPPPNPVRFAHATDSASILGAGWLSVHFPLASAGHR